MTNTDQWVWQTCPACHQRQSYHGMDHCAYCNAPEPSPGFYLQPWPAAAPSLPAAAPANEREAKLTAETQRWLKYQIERDYGDKHGACSDPDCDSVYCFIAKQLATVATLRSTLDAREQRIAELENDLGRESDAALWNGAQLDVAQRDLAAREQRIGELTRERDGERELRMMIDGELEVTRQQVDYGVKLVDELRAELRAELASREARIGELEKENSALRARL